MGLARRAFVTASLITMLTPKFAFAAPPAPNPLLYRVRRGKGAAYLLGAAEATDNGWFVPKIAGALAAADVLWLETPPGSTTAAAEGQQPKPDPALQRIFTEQGFDREHDLFETLPPELSRRTLQWAQKLSLPREQLMHMRPWFARITLQQAFASQRQATATSGAKLVSPERIVLERARQRRMRVESEYPTLADLIRFFADLPAPAQPQYVEELLDYFDKDAAGENDSGKYGWIVGQPDPRSLNEQRERTPDLYRAMHIERNAWWTGRIEGMLEDGRTAFIFLGMNHTLGPDSIQANLARRGLPVETL